MNDQIRIVGDNHNVEMRYCLITKDLLYGNN